MKKLTIVQKLKILGFKWTTTDWFEKEWGWVRDNPHGANYHLQFNSDEEVFISHWWTTNNHQKLYKGGFDTIQIKTMLHKEDTSWKKTYDKYKDVPSIESVSYMSSADMEAWNDLYSDLERRLIMPKDE